ncbi:MAG: hypothetical protein HGA96_00465 [Desulfobulbaceae bacterium]|nr:hypothetical protein [Desulfobulbaceae bacterium]
MFCFDPTISWTTLVQLLGFGSAIWAVIYQFGKQRQLQQEKHKVDLEHQIYEKVVTDIEGSSPTGIAMTFTILSGALENAREKSDQLGNYVPPLFYPEEINSEFSRVNSNLWKVAATIEKYEIIAPNLTLFREALAKKLCELADAYMPIVKMLPYVLLSKHGINNPANLIVLKGEDSKLFQAKVNEFSEIANDVAGFLYDIQVELQNRLLGKIFERTLLVRAPSDQAVLVLTSNDERMLRKAQAYVNGQLNGDDKIA